MSNQSDTTLNRISIPDMLRDFQYQPSPEIDNSLNQETQKKTQQVKPNSQNLKHSYYDFDMAEFPWAVFERSGRPKAGEPIVYEDTIKNPGTGEEIPRRFETYPCPEHGHATHSTFELAYLLIQLYIADDLYTDRVMFGSLSNLARMRGLQVTGPNLKKIRRDLEILAGMKIKSYNAYWDSDLKAYDNNMGWRFFGSPHFLMPTSKFDERQEELNLAYIQVSDEFKKIASTRGLFGLGFSQELFFSLSPMEQRLAVFLSRRFKFQSFVKHRVDRVCAAIPINAKQSGQRRDKLRKITEGLLEKDFPLLSEYTIEKKRGEWTAEFKRKKKPSPQKPFWNPKDFLSMNSEEECLVDDIVKLTGDEGSKKWYLFCLRQLKHPQHIYNAMSIFKETYVHGDQEIKGTKGAVMTGILQRIGDEVGVNLRRQ